ncbi:MAG: peptidase [Acidobacteriota bacterium]
MNHYVIGMNSRLAAAVFLLAAVASCQGQTSEEDRKLAEERRMQEQSLDRKLAQYVRVEMNYDASGLTRSEKKTFKSLIEAAELIDLAFWRQAHLEGWQIRERLERSRDPIHRKTLHLLVLNAGPFDRFNEFEPFYGKTPRPPGAGFYPADLTKEELETYIEAHPDQRDALLDPFTVVRRDGARLVTVPYHEEYGEWIVPASKLLLKASGSAENPSLEKFLESRSEALLTDDYYQSDLDWIDLKDNRIELVFGPYEVYEDNLMGVKTAYEATIAVKDPEESRRLDIYVNNLETLEQNLPMKDRFKRSQVALDSPMVVVTDLYRGGDMTHGYQAVASNLPNDPRVHEAKGTKKTFWKNVIKARLEEIIFPIARKIMAEDQLQYMTEQGFFNVLLMHEIAHALGPRWVGTGEDRVPVNERLHEEYSAIEEGKADVAGLHSLEWFMKEGVIPASFERQHYVSYLGSLYRTIRFGTSEAHGKASLIAINWHTEKGGLVYDSGTGRWSVDFGRIPKSIRSLARELLEIEATGDYDRSVRLAEKYGKVGRDVRATLKRLEDLPIAIEPAYTVKWD